MVSNGILAVARCIKIEPGSQLATMAGYGGVQYESYRAALLKDLVDATAACALALATASYAEAYEQIHALKNATSPTGCLILRMACDGLTADLAAGKLRAELVDQVHAIATETRKLILSFRPHSIGHASANADSSRCVSSGL